MADCPKLKTPEVFKRKRDTLSGRVVRRQLSAKFAADALGPIEQGCEIYCLTMGKFSLIDVLEHVLQFTGPASVTISTWTAAGADITFANRMLTDGRVTDLRFVVDYSFESRQPAYCAALRERFGDAAIRVTKNHAKFVLIRNAEWNVVVRTSMNLNECRRLESLEISDDPAMSAWLQEILDDLFKNQTDSFTRTAGEHCQKFGEEWGDLDAGGITGTDARFFGNGPSDVDLRRVGITRRS